MTCLEPFRRTRRRFGVFAGEFFVHEALPGDLLEDGLKAVGIITKSFVETKGLFVQITEHMKEGEDMNCQICNTPQKADLFAAVTGEPVCSICKVSYVGGLPSTSARIALVREMLGLQPGEFLKPDRLEEARRILCRRY